MKVLVLGVYRAESEEDLSILPFVYICPLSSSIMHEEDRVYVMANPHTLEKCLITLELPLVPGNLEGSVFLGNLPSSYS